MAALASSGSSVQSSDPALIPNRIAGFDCDFVEPPPTIIQTTCPVCLLTIRDPYQVVCCGSKFCHSCITTVKAKNSTCPTCKNKNFELFQDIGLKRALYGLKVYCSYHSSGCEWTGELSQLDSHLNARPQTGSHDGCKFAVINCEFDYAGCTVKTSREDMPQHLQTALVEHFSLLAVTQKTKLAELTQENKALVAKIEELSAINPFPVSLPVFTMKNFEKHKTNDDLWLSTSFYSHIGGYKFSLGVRANGTVPCKGSHISLFSLFMEGENDKFLKWPFRGKIHVKLRSQITDSSVSRAHFEHCFIYDDSVPQEVCYPPTLGPINMRGLRIFIPHNLLEAQNYLVDDTLVFEISRTQVD